MPTSLVIAAIVGAGATAYSAHQESKAAKAAAAAQERVGMANIEAAKEAPKLAAQEAEAKLKLRQASKSQSILTSPEGADDLAKQKTILGV